jgi:hypothetical protein
VIDIVKSHIENADAKIRNNFDNAKVLRKKLKKYGSA